MRTINIGITTNTHNKKDILHKICDYRGSWLSATFAIKGKQMNDDQLICLNEIIYNADAGLCEFSIESEQII